MNNGTFALNIKVTKIGTLKFIKGVPNGVEFNVNNVKLSTDDINLIDFPKTITLVPLACSPTKPHNTFKT